MSKRGTEARILLREVRAFLDKYGRTSVAGTSDGVATVVDLRDLERLSVVARDVADLIDWTEE